MDWPRPEASVERDNNAEAKHGETPRGHATYVVVAVRQRGRQVAHLQLLDLRRLVVLEEHLHPKLGHLLVFVDLVDVGPAKANRERTTRDSKPPTYKIKMISRDSARKRG